MNSFFDKIRTTSLALLILTVSGCKEDMKAHYATSADAVHDGAFERGWLPEVLSQHGLDIQESHDLDSNRGEATFRYTDQLAQAMESKCINVLLDQKDQKRFCFIYKNKVLRPLKMERFQCGTFTILVDLNHQLGYLWH